MKEDEQWTCSGGPMQASFLANVMLISAVNAIAKKHGEALFNIDSGIRINYTAGRPP